MKKTLLTALLAAVLVTASAKDVMRKEKDGTYVVNTTTLAQDVEGYNGPTPVEVYIKKNKIVKVVPLKSQEGPKYVAMVKKEMLPRYERMNVKKGTVQEVDAVTGATFTSRAMQENIKRAVEYYKSHKK
ncbi:MAG: FMN-binding protein [Prevotella sp.]|nr:FMN-binding protein [Prevotella sp.]